MARMNNIIKFMLLNCNIIISLIGLLFFAGAFYLWFANWGDLDPGFFTGLGLFAMFFGLCMTTVACLGCQGINNQNRKFGAHITGRRIIGLHLAILIIGFVIEIYVLKTALSAVQQYQIVYKELNSHPIDPPNYVKFESFISTKFNKFFFGAASKCSTTVYNWFWNWVDHHCPTSMDAQSCQGCQYYSLTFCEADENGCLNSDDEKNNPYCPYTICREGILRYFRQRIKPFTVVVFCVAIFQAIMIILDILVMCFTPRDDLKQILYKSGTLKETS